MNAFHGGNMERNSTTYMSENEVVKMEPSTDIYDGETDIEDDDEEEEEEDVTEINEYLDTPQRITKPNVPINDENICPVCTQAGI